MGYTLIYGILFFDGNLPPMGTLKDIITTNNQKVFKRVVNYEVYANNSLR